MNIGQRIKEAREAMGLSVFDLSLKSEIREQTLRMWECGRREPSDLSLLSRVASALDTSIDFLVNGVEKAAV